METADFCETIVHTKLDGVISHKTVLFFLTTTRTTVLTY